MKASAVIAGLVAAKCVHTAAVPVPVTSVTSEVESDWTVPYYGSPALILGNDGGVASGGFHAWELGRLSPLLETMAAKIGRTKLVTTVYNITSKDLVISIAQPDSIIRVFILPSLDEIESARFTALGDWSAACTWRSDVGNSYLYLFGKSQGKQFLVTEEKESVKIFEVQSFPVEFEPSGCTVSGATRRLFLSTDDEKSVYALPLVETMTVPAIIKVGEAEDDVTGLTIYAGVKSDYLFVAQKDTFGVYSTAFEYLGSLQLTGYDDIEVQGPSIYQGASAGYSSGALLYAVESKEVVGFGASSLTSALASLNIEVNTAYNPQSPPLNVSRSTVCGNCNFHGFCGSTGGRECIPRCECFAGYSGKHCSEVTCTADCSGHGECVGPNQCRCVAGWGGLHCSFALVEPKYETEANGGDGDDPALWISSMDKAQSRIITTIKVVDGAGLGMFDLKGKLLQTLSAAEPNNVDVIYGFNVGTRVVDLAYAACRGDDTLCLFEISQDGTLFNIEGGIQPTPQDYKVYGSCAYRSSITGKQYLFVNAKTAQYLQYELIATPSGALNVTLIRSFTGGSGGQTEGCVTDTANGWLFVGEEPYGLWRYGAEPSDTTPAVLVDKVTRAGGGLFADVEGVTLVEGKTKDKGLIMLSCQGVSAYNIYKRAVPHEFVGTFTITASADGTVDAVSNTDGIAAVGTALGADFPGGLVVVHDDSNQLPGGGTAEEASFKLVSLAAVIERLGGSALADELDPDWDPRA